MKKATQKREKRGSNIETGRKRQHKTTLKQTVVGARALLILYVSTLFDMCVCVEQAFPRDAKSRNTKSSSVLTHTSEEVDRPRSSINKTSFTSGPDQDRGLCFPTQSMLPCTVRLSPPMDRPSENSSVAECHAHHSIMEERAGPDQGASFMEAILQHH